MDRILAGVFVVVGGVWHKLMLWTVYGIKIIKLGSTTTRRWGLVDWRGHRLGRVGTGLGKGVKGGYSTAEE